VKSSHDTSEAERIGSLAQLLVRGPLAGLTSRQSAILLACCSSQNPSVRLLARSLGVSRASVSRALRVLADRGLVTRSVDPTDNRGIVASVTATGTDLVRTIYGGALDNERLLTHRAARSGGLTSAPWVGSGSHEPPLSMLPDDGPGPQASAIINHRHHSATVADFTYPVRRARASCFKPWPRSLDLTGGFQMDE
jgi:DNA-binding MarR family transcriptional regulator